MKISTAKNVHRDFLQDTIEEYVADRISIMHDYFENAASFEEVRQIQGRILELRYLLKAKEYSSAILEKAKRNGNKD